MGALQWIIVYPGGLACLVVLILYPLCCHKVPYSQFCPLAYGKLNSGDVLVAGAFDKTCTDSRGRVYECWGARVQYEACTVWASEVWATRAQADAWAASLHPRNDTVLYYATQDPRACALTLEPDDGRYVFFLVTLGMWLTAVLLWSCKRAAPSAEQHCERHHTQLVSPGPSPTARGC